MEWSSEQARTPLDGLHPRLAEATAAPASAPPSSGLSSSGLSSTTASMSKTPGGAGIESPRIVAAHAGDHALVYAMLRSLNQSPAYEDFTSWLDEPSYEPIDRLLMKQGAEIIAHAQLLHRNAWFHRVKIPVAGLLDFAILPEYASAGWAKSFIESVEEAMRKSGAVVSLVRTQHPDPMLANGWSEVRSTGCSSISVGDLLAYLTAHKRHGNASHVSRQVATIAGTQKHGTAALEIRQWRQIELRGVRRVYDAEAVNGWGALDRSDSYWHWLVGRKAHSDLIVAVEEPMAGIEPNGQNDIVGYAVVHGGQVLEIGGSANGARARLRLLVRACQDAVECGHHTISLHAPASDPLHELIVTAGGAWLSDPGPGGKLLAKLLDPAAWIEAIYPLLRHRAKAAGLRLPLEMGVKIDSARYRLVVTRRSSRLLEDGGAPPDVRCQSATFGQLLIGNLDAATLRSTGEVETSSDANFKRLAVLFPPALFWQSQFDSLRF